jgi:hypothetical protein
VQNGFFGCGRKNFKVREHRHPTLKVWQNGFHLRLLEHKFRDNGFVQRRIAPPRQITRVFSKPLQQCTAKGMFKIEHFSVSAWKVCMFLPKVISHTWAFPFACLD